VSLPRSFLPLYWDITEGKSEASRCLKVIIFVFLIKAPVCFARFSQDSLLSFRKSALQPHASINFDFAILIELRLKDIYE